MKILIATDGSEFSRQAIVEACETVIDGENSAIEIISVFEEVAYTATEPFAIPTDYINEMEKVGREQALKFADDAEAIIRERFPQSTVQIVTKIAKGSAGRMIVEAAESSRADLIVVGSHGRGFWSRTFLGSVSQSVTRHAPCSVLVVRSGGK